MTSGMNDVVGTRDLSLAWTNQCETQGAGWSWDGLFSALLLMSIKLNLFLFLQRHQSESV